MTYSEMVKSFECRINHLKAEREKIANLGMIDYPTLSHYGVIGEDIRYYQMLKDACQEMALQEQVQRDFELAKAMNEQLRIDLEDE